MSRIELAEDLLLSKSVAHGEFPPFLEIIAQNIPYCVDYQYLLGI